MLEVRQALVPGTGNALLLGAAFGGDGRRWGASFSVASVAPKNLGCQWFVSPGREAALDPDLRGAIVLPVGEEADAVTA